jgi:hypothetical protein
VCTGTAEIIPPPCYYAKSFEAFLREDKEISWCLYQLQIHQCQRIVDSIREGTVTAVSDGSYKDTFGTAAWVLLAEETVAYITGCMLYPGAARDHSSYRSILDGLYSVLTVTSKMYEYYNMQEGGITIGCDGLSTLDTSLHNELVLASDVSNFDLVRAIYAL